MKTIINKNTGQVLYCSLNDVDLAENEIAIDDLLTETMVTPYWNFKDKVFYDNANQTQIDDSIKALVPTFVTKRQIKQALVLSSIPLENIDYAISLIEDETERALMEIYWNDSSELERYHPKLIEFSAQLQMTETQLDNLFILANSL